MRKHIVKQGECLTSIARRYGFLDPMAIYNDANNAGFRKLRPNPNILFPGDKIAIPDWKPKTVVCPTNTVNKFRVTLPTKKIRLILRDPGGQPLAGVKYSLCVDGKESKGETGASGLIEAVVGARATHATLSLNGASPQPIGIDHLNPMKDTSDSGVSGVQARLRNLGFLAVPVDGVLGPLTRAAIREFEEKHGMKVSGEISDQLMKKLEQEHGC